MTYDFTNGAYVAINGNKLSGIEEVKFNFSREATVVNSALSVTSPDVLITISRKRHFNDSMSDNIRIQTLSDFSITIYADRCTSVFGGCQWVDYSEEIGKENCITEVIKISAYSYNIYYPQQ